MPVSYLIKRKPVHMIKECEVRKMKTESEQKCYRAKVGKGEVNKEKGDRNLTQSFRTWASQQ